jgi:hypothetical protein
MIVASLVVVLFVYHCDSLTVNSTLVMREMTRDRTTDDGQMRTTTTTTTIKNVTHETRKREQKTRNGRSRPSGWELGGRWDGVSCHGYKKPGHSPSYHGLAGLMWEWSHVY